MVTFGLLLILQQVTDLGEEDFLCGGSGRRGGLGGSGGFLFLLLADLSQLVQALHQPEHHQSQDQEIDDGREEIADGQVILDLLDQLGAGLGDDGLIGGIHPGHPGQGDLDVAEIRAAQENIDNGHDDVVGQAGSDGGESAADDSTNGQCHGVALDGKGGKFIPPSGLLNRVLHM